MIRKRQKQKLSQRFDPAEADQIENGRVLRLRLRGPEGELEARALDRFDIPPPETVTEEEIEATFEANEAAGMFVGDPLVEAALEVARPWLVAEDEGVVTKNEAELAEVAEDEERRSMRRRVRMGQVAVVVGGMAVGDAPGMRAM